MNQQININGSPMVWSLTFVLSCFLFFLFLTRIYKKRTMSVLPNHKHGQIKLSLAEPTC